jgi:hypothetical protein
LVERDRFLISVFSFRVLARMVIGLLQETGGFGNGHAEDTVRHDHDDLARSRVIRRPGVEP